MSTINDYAQVSGYSLNRDKTEVLSLNVHCNSSIIGDYGLKLAPYKIKYLGIWVSQNLIESFDYNEKTTLTKLKTH